MAFAEPGGEAHCRFGCCVGRGRADEVEAERMGALDDDPLEVGAG